MKKFWMLALLLTVKMASLPAQQVITLNAVPAPEGMVWKTPERQYFSNIFNTEVVTNVSTPTLTPYLPDPAIATGTAVIVAPGGGFHALSINNEGIDVARWFADRGIAAFLLKYRLAPTGEDGVAEFIQKMGKTEKDPNDFGPAIQIACADGLAAIAYVREHAAEYGVQPNRIGIMGFSAGGTVAGSAALVHTPANRPDFAAPIYAAMDPARTPPVPADAPPIFLLVASDDVFGFQPHSIKLYEKYVAAGKSAELHVYNKGGHGFGMRKQNMPSDHWIELFGSWLRQW